MSFKVLAKSTLGLALCLSFSCTNVLTSSDVLNSTASENEKSFGIKAVASTVPSVRPSLKPCPVPPPPPPIPAQVIQKIKKENPSLLAELEALKTLGMVEGHAKMTELAKKYPQYFKAPPPLRPAPKDCAMPSGSASIQPPPPGPSGAPSVKPMPSSGSSIQPPPPPPSGVPSTKPIPSGSASCPPPPPPPPIPSEIIEKIKVENPSLLVELEALKTLGMVEGHAKMTELSKTYPQYFKAPPPLPAEGTCPPPPPAQK
jgi:hypothetical protein